MSTFLNRFSNDDDQRVRISEDSAGPYTFHDGLAYDNTDGAELDRLVVSYAETPEFYMAGIGFTAEGIMLVVDASAGLPADTMWQSGLPISRAENRLCVDPTNPVFYVHQGVPFTEVGAVAVNGEVPPEPVLFDTLVFYNEGIEPSIWVTQLRFGISGSNSGWYTVEATFDADHPGLPVEDFLTPTPPVSPAPSTYPGFTITTAAGNDIVDMSSLGWLHSAAPIYIQIVFDDPIDSVGFIYETDGAPFASVLIYNGATLLASNTIDFSGFLGYSTAGSVITPDNRITADGDTRVTADGDTRVWV